MLWRAAAGRAYFGLSAALDLVDTGHEVALYEARPTLGGAVQTLPRREGDPEPPPDNGQHIALGASPALPVTAALFRATIQANWKFSVAPPL